jgi:peptidoglycan/xylan/chitin deacetylase (PgdA/CDA1 family)
MLGRVLESPPPAAPRFAPLTLMPRFWNLARRVKGRLTSTARRLRTHPGVPLILMYHRIAAAKADPWGLAVSPASFDEQLELLNQRWQVLPLGEFNRLHRCKQLPANAVAITFDDGYACNALAAAPILERHGLPATIFLTTGLISSEEEFWWDALERMISTTNAESVELSIRGEKSCIVLGKRDEISVSSKWDATREPVSMRQAAYLKLWATLRDAEEGDRRGAMAALNRQAGISGPARQTHRVMTAVEARQISASGLIEIGAHSVTHPALSRLTRTQQHLEITQSRDACHNLVGSWPRAFAYPYGDYNDDSVEIVRDAGYEIACTTHAASVGAGTRSLQMPRLQVRNWSRSEFTAAMCSLDHE